MSYERLITQKLFESRGLAEASFDSGGSTYKAVFGKYYKHGDEISRDEYFNAKDNPSEDSASAEVAEWEGGYPRDDDLFFKNAERLGLETGDEDLQVGDKKLNYDYAILDRPVKFYHATLPNNVDSILKTGLKMNKQGSTGDKNAHAVYLSGSKEGISQWRGKDTKVVGVTLPAGTKVYQDRQSNAVFVTSDIPEDSVSLEESYVTVNSKKSYTIEYEVTKGKSITVAIAPMNGENYFVIGNLIGSALSKEFYGIRRIPNTHHSDREWIFNYIYTRRK